MIRNNYILPYEASKNSSKILPSEEKFISHGENYKLYLERPLELSHIKKIKEYKIYKFIDNVMCDKNINNLLFSSNAKKIASLYLKQKKFLLRQHAPLQIEDDNLFRKKVISFPEKIKRENIMENIKSNIEKFRKSRKKILTQMIEKSDEFLNSQPNVDKKLEILETKAINEIRLKGYKKAFDKCLNLSLTRNNFEMVNLNTNDVFGRLYNNKALRISYKMKKNNSADKINTSKESSSRKDPLSFKNMIKKYKVQKNNNENNSEINVNQHYKKRIVKFKLNSNLTKDEHNLKQFNKRITKNMIKRCWSAISSGPKIKPKQKIKNDKLKEIYKKKYNYKILSNKKNGDINDISLYNTMIVDDPFLKKCKIKNENYRDKNNNSSLHISVSNNSMKMVKYFLGKKIKNVNVKNDKGKTALHLACTTGNEDMINLLLKNGADVNALDDQGNKPFDLISTERSKN
jgi:hypothetical protein